jgi:hypothetical protein
VRAGWRWLRTSNLYRFAVPAEPVAIVREPLSSLSVPSSANESLSGKSAALAAMLRAAAAVPDLLALRRKYWGGG